MPPPPGYISPQVRFRHPSMDLGTHRRADQEDDAGTGRGRYRRRMDRLRPPLVKRLRPVHWAARHCVHRSAGTATRSARPVRPLPRAGFAPPRPPPRTSNTRTPPLARAVTLAHHAITLTPIPGQSIYLEAGGFLPGHTVSLSIDGKAMTTLRATTLGNVTSVISPSRLHLPGGSHALSLGSLLITETASFSS